MNKFFTILFIATMLAAFAFGQETDSLLLGNFDNNDLGIWTGHIGDAWLESLISPDPDPEGENDLALEIQIDCGISEDDQNKGGLATSNLNIVVDGDTATAFVVYIWVDEETHAQLDGAQIYCMDQVNWAWQSAWHSPGMLPVETWFRMVYEFSQSFNAIDDFGTLIESGLSCGVEFVFNAGSDWIFSVFADDIHLIGVKGDITPVEPVPVVSAPGTFVLEQNYPNPFNPSTNIVYTLPQRDRVTITIYDVTGRLVTTLIDHEQQPAGRVAVPFNAGDLSSGIYYYKVQTSNAAQMNKMVLVR